MTEAKILEFAKPLPSDFIRALDPDLYQYICEECEGDTFTLMDNGEVWCATCDTEAAHLVCGERNA